MRKPCIAIIEDDDGMCFFYKSVLSGTYDLTFFRNLSSIDLHSWPYDLTIADMVLPDGFLVDDQPQLFTKARSIIIVSSLNEISTMRRTKHLGGVDYLVKPLTENELLFKVENILQGQTSPAWERDPDGLTPKEEKILKFLKICPNQQCLKRDLQLAVWKTVSVQPNTLEVHLSNLRKKIAMSGHTIVTTDEGHISLVRLP